MQSKHKRKSDKTGPSAKKRSTYTKNGFKYQEKKSTTAKQQSDFAQFNQKITSQETAVGILNLLASRKGVLSAEAGGGNLSTVNFSTAIHRIAKHINNQNNNNDSDVGNDRGKVLSDPRFALFICSLSEAILEGAEINIDGSKRTFGARELSNCAWGIAKLQIAPPKTVMPIDLEHVEENLMKKSQQVRSIILEIAKERASKSLNTKPSASAWIPALSELCGLLIDGIGTKAMQLDPRRFKQQELSNLMYSATIVHRPSEEVFNFVVRSIILSASSTENRNKDDVLKPQEWSLPLWCLAKAELKSGHEEKLLPFLLNLMDNELGFLERFKPQELSNVAWGVATIISKRQEDATGPASEAALGLLRHATRELIRRDGIGYNTQELTNLAWAMATLGFGMIPGTLDSNRVMANSYTNLESDDPEGDRALMHDSLSIIFREMKKKIRNFKSQELNNISWMMARLSESDDELFYMIGKELTNPERRIEATDLTVTLWSMATEEYINDDLYRAIAARLSTIEPHKFKPNELSNALWAFATAGVLPEDRHYFDTTLLSHNSGLNNNAPIRDPVVACYHLAAEEVRRRPHSFKPQELKDLLWSFVKVGMRHPSLFKFAAEHLVGAEDDLRDTGRGLDEFDVQAIANLAYVYARHCQLGAEVLQTYHEKCPIPQTGGRLACYTVSFLDIGEGLLRKLYSRIANNQIANQGDIMVMSAQNVANIAWAFAIYGFKHPRYLDAVHNALQTRMGNCQLRYSTGSFGGQEIANTLWAFATLNYYPNGLLSVLEEHVMEYFLNGCNVEEISKVFTRQELANIAFSLCVFGEYPTRLVELIFTGLLGNKDQCDPLYVQRVYGDSGIDQVHINSLIYLQIMLDLEIGRGKHPFSLPENFPQAWSEDVMFSSYSSDDTNFSEINTSNTQVAVSKAFDRIGFPHVDEHIHSMMDLVREYGISMGAHPVNVLSMDIANVQSRIGIEIDGPGHWVSDISNDDAILNHIGYYRPNKNGILEYVFQWSTDDQEINGSTALKFRMFQKMGWKVINIPFWDWSKIYGNEKLEEEYAKNVLDKVL
ncbi:FAST kinase-like protein, subdomain 1 [Nitzschia inconspicua]|uniref:FAST kinase-like protein, subdomain 1 n=1 Tax=Nitzschia inconspicua TaxID=303405 RepID=A0A9K3KSA3_9STRA|nr:FAST kinase-like protein, subdomain 1 [Nitzschia inconspicua]